MTSGGYTRVQRIEEYEGIQRIEENERTERIDECERNERIEEGMPEDSTHQCKRDVRGEGGKIMVSIARSNVEAQLQPL